MKIALDYDNTYNVDKPFWNDFVNLCFKYGHEVRIVTARSPKKDFLDDDRVNNLPVIYCDGIAKRFYCNWFAEDEEAWNPDVWIDDKPEGIDKNSSATREVLETWRKSDDYLK